jgi:hypothetical protein
VLGRSMLNCVLTPKIGESGMAALRIFSYLPNPRIWKATITARLCGVEIEVRGASPRELSQWLWDFDARPIAQVPRETLAGAERTGRIGFADQKLYKTDAFLKAHPFGTVPAAFSLDGCTGIFESNSIMRAVARLGAERFPIYGRNVYESSRIAADLGQTEPCGVRAPGPEVFRHCLERRGPIAAPRAPRTNPPHHS